jgi:DNA-binding IclR family transcriptional regulator
MLDDMTTCTSGPAAAIDKAMTLFDALRSANTAMRLSDLSRRTGLPKSTTHRMLSALMTSGLVVRFGVGYAAADRSTTTVDMPRNLLRRLSPYVGDLFMRTRLTSGLAVLDGADVVFAHRVHSHHDMWLPSDDSGRARAHRTAAGRLLLSRDLRAACDAATEWGIAAEEAADLCRDLLRIRERGFAVAERDGVICLAVALPTASAVALTVRGPTPLSQQDRIVFWLRAIAEATRAVAGTDAQ